VSAVAGALGLVVLFGLDLFGASLDFMGFSDDAAVHRILREYGRQIIHDQISILAVYVGVGAVFGLIGGALLGLRDRAEDQTSSGRRYAALGATSALFGHACVFLHSLQRYPQLYSEALYDRGGWRRRLMVACTDLVTTESIVIALALAITLLLPWRFVIRQVGVGLRRLAAARDGRGARRERRTLLALGGLVTITAVAVTLARRHDRARRDDRPNVLLLAVDSLRADRVFSSTTAERFPTIARLAQESVRFRAAYATVPRTFPSFVTLLTGRWPHHHGIRHMFPTAAQRRAIGPALPAALDLAGYYTAVVGDYAAEIFSRTPLGFSYIDVPRFDMHTIVQQRSLQVHPNVLPYATSRLGGLLFMSVAAMPERSDPALLAERAIAALDEAGAGPFFLTVFFSAAHFPYASPAPFYRRFADPAYAGPFRYQKPPLATAAVGPDDAAQIRALYDGAVRAVDDGLGRVLEHLARSGRDRNTIVILLADHGENLYDDPARGMGHGDHLNGSAAEHVPLLIRDPRATPHDVPGIVRDVDLSPTLLARTGTPALPTDGVDLGPLLRGERTSLDLAAFTETEFWFTRSGPGFEPDERLPYPEITGATDLADDGDIFLRPEWQDMVVVAKHRAIRTDRWKLVYQPTRTGVRYRLYDLQEDPEERRDVSEERPETLTVLGERLRAWLLSDGRTELRGGFAVPR
jgi:arylsulfatase A-like enzyme